MNVSQSFLKYILLFLISFQGVQPAYAEPDSLPAKKTNVIIEDGIDENGNLVNANNVLKNQPEIKAADPIGLDDFDKSDKKQFKHTN